MSSTFRTAVIRTPAGPDSIEIIEVPVVDPGPGEVRVEIAAASVNPVDLALADGMFHELGFVDQPDHTGIGWDFAGTVTAVGPDVDVPAGARVAGLVTGFDRDYGTYAEQLIVAATDIALVPDGLDLTTAATVPMNGLAAAQAVDLLGDGAGRTLLVTGAAGTVGAYAVTFARERGWLVTGLARTDDERFVRDLGADFTTRTDARAWDAVVDAAALQERGLALVRDNGVFVGVRPGAEPKAERGVTVGAVSVQPDGTRLARLLADTASGRLTARVHAVVPLEQAAEAHRAVAKGGVRGKYVIQP
ncbi:MULTISPECIES: NADP-dependent oxidoreductase [Nocardia]|uniref:NADP-dependent oxidoreductase n=1 Tax=Nocardia TaxID=1817 RepID=UPI000D699177|nr:MULTISPECIES: NADP-dependent oxidoreductase [Nocardia]